MELKPTPFKDKRDFSKCMHLNELGGCSLYYHQPECHRIDHSKLSQCIFRNKDTFDWTDPDHAKALLKSFEYFMGDQMPREMDLGNKTIVAEPPKRKPKALKRSPLAHSLSYL